jgi:excisionase family DNA binding protein
MMDNLSDNRWLTVTEAAAHLRCSRNFLDKDRLSHLHGIPFSRLGRHIRYSVHELNAFLEANKQNARGEA